MIHLNTAGAGLMPAPVVDAMTGCLRTEARHGAYETEQRYAEVLEEGVYRRIAALLNAPADSVALFDNATRAWCSVVCRLPLGPADRVWITPYEYAGNLITLLSLRDRTGCRVEIVPTLPGGDLDLGWMAANITDQVALVSVTHIPSGCGIVNPVAEIGAILEPYRCHYAVDGCQSAGHLPIDVAAMRCDLFTGAGRKFLRGPRGTGFAYVSRNLRESLTLEFADLHVARVASADRYVVEEDSARVLELAERGPAAFVGLDAALAHHESGAPHVNGEVFSSLKETLAELPGVELIAPGSVQSGILSFRHDTLPPDRICAALSDNGINTWRIRGDHTPVYMAERGVDTAVRASVHYDNSLDEIARTGRVLHGILTG